MALTRPRVGVFGGAFDPPHNAHVALVQAALAQLGLAELRIFPTGQAWHKDRALSAAEDRLAMARLAFEGIARVMVDAREILRPGPTYTLDTLRELQQEQPAAQLVLIVGADQCDLRSWREPDEILQLASLAVAPREGYVCAPGANVTDLVMASVDLSSTTVRERLAEGMGEDAVDPAVLGLIRARGLYGRPPC